MVRLLALLGVIASAGSAVADLELPAVFSDSMVLQRNQPVQCWGWCDAEQTVKITFGGREVTAVANRSGRWECQLPALPAGGPHVLQVDAGEESLQVKDILIGEVWLCSGQSNMAMTVNRARNFEQEAKAADFPQIRMFKESSAHASTPQTRCHGAWTVCTPETVGGFSATAYFFGRRLHQELDVPIGLVNSSVGGTSVESWTSLPAQSAVDEIKPRLDAWKELDAAYDEAAAEEKFRRQMAVWRKRADTARQAEQPVPRRPRQPARPRDDRNYPASLFNGKINPLVGYTIKGAIWYQGENSSGRGFAHLYGVQLRTLITDWRARWGQGEFPFAWVQLPDFRKPQTEPVETSGWVLVQEGMLKTLAVPNTGMAVTIDVGEENDIHPRDKQSVGHRLAQWALSSQYGKDLVAMGPIYRTSSISGGKVTVEFDFADGLKAPSGDVVGFAIAGSDRRFVRATARIDGKRVIVSSPEVLEPVAVRYAWAGNPVISLYNEAGIPASPFRTDDWDETENQ